MFYPIPAIGVFLMLSRAIFDNEAALASSDHLLGAQVLTTAVIAWAEVARPLRFLNILFGLWLIIAPRLLDGGTVAGSLASLLARAALIALSLPNGKLSKEHLRELGQVHRLIGRYGPLKQRVLCGKQA